MSKVMVQWLWTVSAGLLVGALGYILFTENASWKFCMEACFLSALCFFAAKKLEKAEIWDEEAYKRHIAATLTLIEKWLAKLAERNKI